MSTNQSHQMDHEMYFHSKLLDIEDVNMLSINLIKMNTSIIQNKTKTLYNLDPMEQVEKVRPNI